MKFYTNENPADVLTKVLPQNSFHNCMVLMGLMDRAEFTRTWEHQDGDCELRYGALKP